MLSKEIKSVIRPFYRTIIKKGIQNNEPIKLGSNNNLNLKNYKIFIPVDLMVYITHFVIHLYYYQKKEKINTMKQILD